MICPNCGKGEIKTMDTMPRRNGETYRRKKCKNCNALFRTVEIVDNGTEEFSAGYYIAMKNKMLRK